MYIRVCAPSIFSFSKTRAIFMYIIIYFIVIYNVIIIICVFFFIFFCLSCAFSSLPLLYIIDGYIRIYIHPYLPIFTGLYHIILPICYSIRIINTYAYSIMYDYYNIDYDLPWTDLYYDNVFVYTARYALL